MHPVDPVRSKIMRAVRRTNTTPELAVRRELHRQGFRFRLHRKDLPGTPDIVLPKYRTAVFVHGCFWHRHEGCRHTTSPKTRAAFWEDKFRRNVERDADNEEQLARAGWRIIKIWECEARGDGLRSLVACYFGSRGDAGERLPTSKLSTSAGFSARWSPGDHHCR